MSKNSIMQLRVFHIFIELQLQQFIPVLQKKPKNLTSQYKPMQKRLNENIRFADCFVHPANELRDLSVKCVASNVAAVVNVSTRCRDDSSQYPLVIM